MKKLLKSDIWGFVNSAQMHYSWSKSQHLQLLFMNSSCKPPKMRAKKKKKGKMRTWDVNVDPNLSLDYIIFIYFLCIQNFNVIKE